MERLNNFNDKKTKPQLNFFSLTKISSLTMVHDLCQTNNSLFESIEIALVVYILPKSTMFNNNQRLNKKTGCDVCGKESTSSQRKGPQSK